MQIFILAVHNNKIIKNENSHWFGDKKADFSYLSRLNADAPYTQEHTEFILYSPDNIVWSNNIINIHKNQYSCNLMVSG